jgi:hypothetical protein
MPAFVSGRQVVGNRECWELVARWGLAGNGTYGTYEAAGVHRPRPRPRAREVRAAGKSLYRGITSRGH